MEAEKYVAPKKESKLLIISVAVIVAVVLIVVGVLWAFVFRKGEEKKQAEEKWEYQMSPLVAMGDYSIDNNYTVSIYAVSPAPVPFSQIKWYILAEDVLQAGNLTLVANANTTMSNSICVYTYDTDGNDKLSVGDTLKIWDTGDKTIQYGWKFRLFHIATNSIMGEVPL